MSADRPIIFSAPMVRALLREARQPGTGKTMTRRVIRGVPMFSADYDAKWHPHVCPPGGAIPKHWSWWEGPSHGPSLYHQARLPYAVGSRLWVRETARAEELPDGRDGVRYLADDGWHPIEDSREAADRWVALHAYRRGRGLKVPPIHLPRWTSRLTLLVSEVRVERLQDISEADAKAEGAEGMPTWGCHRNGFHAIWLGIHGHESWASNPWVAAISFRPVLANIDALPAAAEPAP